MVDVPRWLEDLMDLLDLDTVERADWIRHWNDHNSWRRLGHWGLKLLKDRGHVTATQLEEAVRIQRESKEPDLGKVLIALGLVGEREVMQSKAMELGIGFVDLERVNVEDSAIQLANRKLVTTHGAIPVKKDGSTVWLAMSDPQNIAAAEAFRIESECRIIPVLATQPEIQRAIDRYYPNGG